MCINWETKWAAIQMLSMICHAGGKWRLLDQLPVPWSAASNSVVFESAVRYADACSAFQVVCVVRVKASGDKSWYEMLPNLSFNVWPKPEIALLWFEQN